MVDTETLGLHTKAVVLSAAFVPFKYDGTEMSELCAYFNPKGQRDKGRSIDFNTVTWWLKQTGEAKTVFDKTNDALDCDMTLAAIKGFISGMREAYDLRFWAKPMHFDKRLLDSLFEDFGIAPPWGYRDWGDVGTIVNFAKACGAPDALTVVSPTAHECVSDCRDQIKTLVNYMNFLKGAKTT